MAQEIRLNKYISESGLCSRRQADKLIEEGKITVDGVVTDLELRLMEVRLLSIRESLSDR